MTHRKHFFETFGYYVERGAFAGEAAEISARFDDVVRSREVPYDAHGRGCTILATDHPLTRLASDPRIAAVIEELLGPEAAALECDASVYAGNTGWHRDGPHLDGRYVGVAMYLEPLTGATGCLRVVPSGHRGQLDQYWDPNALWNIDGCDVPAVALETSPGDVIFFDHNTPHASFGGRAGRRQLRFNFAALDRQPAACASGAASPSDMASAAAMLVAAISSLAPQADDPDVTVSLSAIVEKLVAEQIVASDFYAAGDDATGLRFIGRMLFSPFPVLLTR